MISQYFNLLYGDGDLVRDDRWIKADVAIIHEQQLQRVSAGR